jgi:hypothetical protein
VRSRWLCLAGPFGSDCECRCRANVCDAPLARAWVSKAARFGLSFSVALPTYRCSAGYDATGKLLNVAMDSVQPAWPSDTRVLEFATNADDMATLVQEWRYARPPQLREIIWYRVPVATDVRNWCWTTLSAVMSGRKPLHHLEVLQEGENPIDLSIANTGGDIWHFRQAAKQQWPTLRAPEWFGICNGRQFKLSRSSSLRVNLLRPMF